ncbi:MAG TPA: hypothetical protein VEI96_00205 [Thermodesulfovibrionales bacterium]|nr:hypothetical protein [Thermodesulfovibrionales bacterium]
MKYTMHGPFEFRKSKNGLVDRSKGARQYFWDKVKNSDELLSSACGCYLFAVHAAKGIKPWYVGLAAKQSFQNECFATHKITIYNEALASKKGTPLLFLITKRTKNGKFAKPGKNGHRSSEYLETILIGTALEKNSELMNIKKTAFLRRLSVPCVINTPSRKPSKCELEFKKTIK